MYKCNKCGSEDNDKYCAEWCCDCNDFRSKVIPEKREYTHELIFDKYLDDKCPVCDGYIKSDSEYSHTESGGKCMAKYFRCKECCSEYTVGYNRLSHPIQSEITYNALF